MTVRFKLVQVQQNLLPINAVKNYGSFCLFWYPLQEGVGPSLLTSIF